MSGDASTAFGMEEKDGGTQSFSISHLESLPHSSPGSKESNLSSRRERRRGVNALGCVCLVVGQQQMKGTRRYKYPTPKLVVTMQDTVFIDTTNLRSVLLRGAWK
jgi:hypothetical protein